MSPQYGKYCNDQLFVKTIVPIYIYNFLKISFRAFIGQQSPGQHCIARGKGNERYKKF